ncbi:MAG TPA: hypothetical protein VHO28_06560 [Ignavibacteriales bacterium]|nr:hypothetical protein [Ignavibacteriales bacterium]
MAVKTSYGPRANNFLIIFFGAAMLAASAIVYFLILRSIYGNIAVSEISPTRENIIKAGFADKKIAILHSKYTENMLAAKSDSYLDNITVWKRFLSNRHYKYDVITDEMLESGEHYKYSAIILPGASALSKIEIFQLKKYLEAGGGIFGTGGIGLYSEIGKWKDWSFYSEVFGLEFSYENKPDSGLSICTIIGGLPITAGIPSGYAFKIASWTSPIACKTAEPRTISAGYLFNYRTKKGLILDEIEKSSAISYGNYGDGRYIWFGFQLDAITGAKTDHIYFEKLINNSLNWVVKRPDAYITNWPDAHDAAAIVLVMEGGGRFSSRLASLLDSLDIPANLAFDGGRIHYDNVQTVPQKIDMGMYTDIKFSSSDDSYNYLWKRDKLLYSQNSMKDKYKEGAGFLLFRKNTSHVNTLKAAEYAGINCVFYDSLADRSEPVVEKYGDYSCLIVPVTARSERFLYVNENIKTREHLAYTFKEDIQRIQLEKGIYALKIHADMLGDPAIYNSIADALKYLKQKNIWIASVSALKKWRFCKERLNLSVEERSAKRTSIKITNNNGIPVKDVAIVVNLNLRAVDVQITSDIFGDPKPEYAYDLNSQSVLIKIKEIAPGKSISYSIDYENLPIAVL